MKQSKLLTLLLSTVTALFTLTAAIALPILTRPFYSLHIEPLGLEEYTGLSRDEILTAYDEMMDYCTGLSSDFSAGVLPFSQSGADHFRDVRGLFLLDLWAAGITGLLLLVWAVFGRRSPMRPARLLGRGFPFWGSVGLGGTFLLIGGLAGLDFDRAFVLFHALFFPGKDNWLFDWRTDPIILILPQKFFLSCAVAILAIILILCAVFILFDLCSNKKQ